MKLNIQHLRNAIEIVRMIRPLSDIPEYLRYRRRAPLNGPERAFRVRQLPGVPLTCRPGTTDALVLQDTFGGLFHLPPAPLSKGATILDLGANVGFVAAHYAQLYPDARVVSVEMDPGNAKQAELNTHHVRDRVTVVHAAIWKECGTVRYGGTQEWGFRIDTGVSANEPVPAGVKTARAISIDALLRENGMTKVDFLKMDIEGAESEVIGDGGTWPSLTRCISVEVHAPITTREIERQLAALGFKTHIDQKHWALVHGVKPQST